MSRVALALALLALGTPAGAENEAVVLPVVSTVVERLQSYTVMRSYAGRVEARRASDLGFDRPGILHELHVDEGDRVSAGQPLAELDTRRLEAQRRELASRLQASRARLGLARATSGRQRALQESDVASAQTLDEAVSQEQALSAEVAAARASLESVEVQLALSRIAAPFDGEITERLADEGAVVNAGQPILRLIEGGVLEARIGVSPRAAESLRSRTGDRFELDAEGRALGARLGAVLGLVDPETRTVPAVFHLDADSGLRDGDIVRVSIPTEVAAEGFWVPLTALAESRRGLWSAYALVVDDGGALRTDRRQVEVVHVEAERAFVRGTLRDGERVVATGVHRLVPGQRVRELEPDPGG